MKTKYIFYLWIGFFSLSILSCKKETLDPTRYDDLLFRSSVERNFTSMHATLNGTSWKATGKATLDSVGMLIEGFSESKIQIYIDNFNSLGELVVNKNSKDSVTITNSHGVFTSKNIKSNGVLKLTHVDSTNKWIEGTFLFTLYSNGGDSVIVKDGYFKISYKENFLNAKVNFEEWSADTLLD